MATKKAKGRQFFGVELPEGKLPSEMTDEEIAAIADAIFDGVKAGAVERGLLPPEGEEANGRE